MTYIAEPHAASQPTASSPPARTVTGMTQPHPENLIPSPRHGDQRPDRVWYVSYGSNMSAARLAYYLAGGTPPGTTRCYAGARNPVPPTDRRGAWLPGGIYFARHSSVWGGGLALYDPNLPGRVPVRAHLVTREQFSDVVAQEMRRDPGPGADLDLTTVLTTGRDCFGAGPYETLLHVGDLDGTPMLTFTAPWRCGDVDLNAPSGPYLAMLGAGLVESHHWDVQETAAYLASLPGASGHWSTEQIIDLLTQPTH